MSGDDHVRERDEALDHVIGDDGARQVLEEEVGLLLVDVDRNPAELAGLERLDCCLRVDQTAAARIDQQGTSFDSGQRASVDDVIGLAASREHATR